MSIKNIAELRRVKRDALSFLTAALTFLSAPHLRIFIITSVFFFATTNLFAQRAQLDSLITLNNAYSNNDNHKLELLNTIAEKYTWVQIDTALQYANQAIRLAQNLNNNTALVTAYNNKAWCLNNLAKLDEEEKVLDAALKLSQSNNDKNGKALTLLNFSQLKKGDEKKKLIDEALLLYTQTQNIKGLGMAWNNVGLFLLFSNTDSALICYNKAINYFKQQNHQAWIGYTLNNISYCFLLLNKLDTSLAIAKSLLDIGIRSGNISHISSGYGSIGNYYYMISDNTLAIKNYLSALRLVEQMNSVSLQSPLFNNIGSLYNFLDNNELAIIYLKKGREASSSYPENLIFSLFTLSDAFIKQEKYDSARVYAQNATEIALKTSNQLRLYSCYISLSEIAIETKNFDTAFFYLNKLESFPSKEALEINGHYYYYNYARAVKNAPETILLKNNINPQKRSSIVLQNFLKSYNQIKLRQSEYDNQNILLELSKTYEEQGNIEKAYQVYKEYVNVVDSVSKTDNLNVITNLQLQYETEKQEQQIASLQKDKALHQSEIKKQKAQRNILIGGCALVLLLIGFIVNAYIVKTKSNKEIEKTFNHLQASQQQLVQQGKLIALAKMTSDVAHRIKDPIGTIKELSPKGEQLVKQYENATNETEKTALLQQLKTYLTEIYSNGKMANDVVKEVLAQTRKQTG